jgi:hypothetical protein
MFKSSSVRSPGSVHLDAQVFEMNAMDDTNEPVVENERAGCLKQVFGIGPRTRNSQGERQQGKGRRGRRQGGRVSKQRLHVGGRGTRAKSQLHTSVRGYACVLPGAHASSGN